MSYYQRPMGDYKTYGYAGDPGFLSSLWKGVKKIAAPVLGGMIAGPAGAAIGSAIAGGGGAATPGVMPQPTVKDVRFGPFRHTTTTPPSFPGMGSRGPSMSQFYSPGMTAYHKNAALAASGLPRGYHYAKDGSGRVVRNRRMNVANPRALRRAMRRVQGFEKLARRTITFTRRTRMKKSK